MKEPRYDDKGDLVLESVEQLSYDELDAWIRARLTGYDLGRAGPNEAPHDQLVAIYSTLNRLAREDLQKILSVFIEEFATDEESVWRAEPGTYLFLLFDPVLLNAPLTETVVARLTALLEDKLALSTLLRSQNHRRVLQGLVTLGYRANVDFWRWHASVGDQDVLPTIFEGFCNLDLSAAFEWLGERPRPDVAGDIVLNYLPYLLEVFGLSPLRPLLTRLIPNLPNEYIRQVVDYLRDMGLPLDDMLEDMAPPEHTPPLHPITTPYLESAEVLDPPEIIMGGRIVEGAEELRALYQEFFAGADWNKVSEKLGNLLPQLIQDRATNSDRTATAILHDLFQSTIQALDVNLRGPAELRIDQRACKDIWVAAQPFLDLVEQRHGGMYEATVARLNKGLHITLFQFDRTYFDEFVEKLKNDDGLRENVTIDKPEDTCQVRYIPVDNSLTPLEFSVWNPGLNDMAGFINIGDRIKLIAQSGQYRLGSKVVMKQVVDKFQVDRLYEALRKFEEDARLDAKVVAINGGREHIR